MVSFEDVLLRIRGQDNSGPAFNSASQRAGALKTAVGGAVTMASAAMLNFAKDSVDSAMTAEKEWARFGNVVNKGGGNWEQQSSEIKSWVRTYSDSMGRSVADTRSAMTTFMNMGMSLGETQEAMKVTSNYAAQMGISQEEAAGQLQKALMGAGRPLKALGLNIKDYKDETTGAIDKQKLFADIMKKTEGAAGSYAQTTEGKMQLLNNTLASMKTDFGRALIDALLPLIPVVQSVLDTINGLPGPIKTIGFVAITLGAGLGVVAGPLMSIIGLMQTLGITLPTISGLMGILGGETAALSAEEIALAAAEAGLTAEEIGSAVAHTTNGVALAGEGVAAEATGGAFGFLAAMEMSALWPILAIVAAIAVFVIAVEQIGEALGWWTDFGTMLDAIKDGVRRLWEAFINNPNVQATIEAVKGALQALWNAVQPIFQWLGAAWNNLFKSDGAGSGGPDVVRMIIDAFGTLGKVAGDVINAIVKFGQLVYTALSPIVGLVSNIINIFSGMLSGQIGIQQGVMMILANVSKIYLYIGQLMARIGMRILTGIVNALRPIPQRLWQFLQQAAMRLLLFGVMALIRARVAGRNILNGIINYVRQLPGRVYSFMMQIPGRIASAAGAAVGAAANLARQLVTTVVNGVKGIADAVYNEFMNIGQRIRDSVSNAVSAATNFGNDIKNAVLNALNIASPGIIQKKIAIEFADIPARITESEDDVRGSAKSYAENIKIGFDEQFDISRATNLPEWLDIVHNIFRTYGAEGYRIIKEQQMGMATRLSEYNSMRSNSQYVPSNESNKRVTIVNVNEGAVPVDARNMTKQEAQGVVTLAFESIMDNPDGVGGA